MNKSRPHFDFGALFQRTKQYVDQHNSQQDKLTNKLNASHRATAELVVRLYTKQLNQAAQLQELERDNLPGFRTYNASLAKCKGCTKRTILNHKERLKRSGFIVREEHRGSGGVELWINPVIFGEPQQSENLPDGITRISTVASLFYPEGKNFHPLVHEPQEQNNKNSRVNSEKEVPGSHRSGLPPTDAPAPAGEPAGTRQEPDMNTGKNVLSAPKGQEPVTEKSDESGQQELGTVETINTQAEHISLLNLVRAFWQYTHRVLYPDLLLSDPEKREILNHIWVSVYKKFRIRGNLQEWNEYQQILYQRVAMVRRWLDRSPSHWIPKPYLYFHPHNTKNGFSKTWEWYVRQETLKREVRNQLLIQQTQHEWTQHDKGRGRHKHQSRLQLFRIQQKRLSQYRDEALMRVYYASLQHSLHLENLRHAAP